jgi:hypothetical protein
MRATEIIRGVLDLIDQVEQNETSQEPVVIAAKTEIDPGNELDDNVRRFKQIIDLVSGNNDPAAFANQPDERVADIDSVTVDAGGGMHSPKKAIDIRSAHSAMFPFIQGIVKE